MCFVLYCFEPLSRGKSWPVPLKGFSSSGPWYKKLVISAPDTQRSWSWIKGMCCYRCVGGPEWNLLLFGSPHIHCIRLSQTGDLFAATRHPHFSSAHHWPFLVNSSSSPALWAEICSSSRKNKNVQLYAGAETWSRAWLLSILCWSSL